MTYIRVTEALNRYSDYSSVPENILAYASNRGVRCHQFLHLYARNMLLDNDVDFDCLAYVQAGVNWLDSYVEKFYFLEKRYYCNKLLLTGQVDLICKIKGDKGLTLIDYKTCTYTSKTWGLQTAAYQWLATQSGLKINRRLVLQLDKEENATVHEFTGYEEEIKIFIGILNAERYFK